MSNAGWCCSNEDGNGMWYTPEYPEEVFFEHWTFMAERYLDNPLVIGADLRNELRGINDELVPGGVRYATWGLGQRVVKALTQNQLTRNQRTRIGYFEI